MDDDLYCTQVEQEVLLHLTRCSLDDFKLGATDFTETVGGAFAQVFRDFCDAYDNSNTTQ